MQNVDPQNWEADLKRYSAEAEEKKQTLYFYVTASKNAETGLPWCPDCVKAAPFIEQAIEKLKGKAMFVTSALERNSYKGLVPTCDESGGCVLKTGPTHPYRTSEVLKLSCIPTLYKWDTTEQRVIDRLLEEKCYDQDALNQFLGL